VATLDAGNGCRPHALAYMLNSYLYSLGVECLKIADIEEITMI
jgi:hypothetical protein